MLIGFKKVNPEAVSTKSDFMTLKLIRKTTQTISWQLGSHLARVRNDVWSQPLLVPPALSQSSDDCAAVADLSQTRILGRQTREEARSLTEKASKQKESQGAPRQLGEGGEG